jgi:probable rRNA maturation factor
MAGKKLGIQGRKSMIFIDNRQTKVEVEELLESTVRDIIVHALEEESVLIECEVSVIFVDNDEIKELNRNYRNIDKPTDVLSFPMLNYPEASVFKDVYVNHNFEISDLDEGKLILGDIAISLEQAMKQSVEYNHSFFREVCYLSIHSVLHLLGYDHMQVTDKDKMRIREEEILNKFNICRK